MFDEVRERIEEAGEPYAVPVAREFRRESRQTSSWVGVWGFGLSEWIRKNANDLAAVMVDL